MDPSSHPINITTTAPSPATSAVPQPHDQVHPRLLFSGSASLGGTHIGAEGGERSNLPSSSSGFYASGSLLPPMRSPSNPTISPRAPSPIVGAIGGHRSPSAGAAQGAGTSSGTAGNIGGSTSRSTSSTLPRPLSLFELGSRDDTLFAGFAGGMSPSGGSSAFAPFAIGLNRPASAVESAFYEGDKPAHVNRASTLSPAPADQPGQSSSSSSPARSGDRPTSRLDFGRLQQRSNAAAAAAAAAALAASQSQSGPSNSRQEQPRAHASAGHGGAPGVSYPSVNRSPPELVRPRPEVAVHRSFSGDNAAGNFGKLSLDQSGPPLVSPDGSQPGVAFNSNLSSPLDSGVPGAYPFPGSQQRHQQQHHQQQYQQQQSGTPTHLHGSRNAIDRLNNHSRASQRSPAPARIASPLDPNRHRFSSPVPLHLGDLGPAGQAMQPHHGIGDASGAQFNNANPTRKQRVTSSSPDNDPSRRLTALEMAMTQLTQGLTGIARDVSWLMEREKMRGEGGVQSHAEMIASAKEAEIRAMREQLDMLSGNVRQLVSVQQQQQQLARRGSGGVNVSGLGLAGNGERAAPLRSRVSGGAPPSPQHMAQGLAPLPPSDAQQGAPRSPLPLPTVPMVQRGPSPRPGAGGRGFPQQQQQPTQQNWLTSPNADVRSLPQSQPQRWSQHLSPNAGGGMAGNAGSTGHQGGASESGSASTSIDLSSSPLIVSKWEHLPLQPDLLRSVLKYGLGPPNKVQQRALPFLLRGSDVIAQAPPTQERIASYVIPAIHVALTTLRCPPLSGSPPANGSGPFVLIVTTTVDQATQAQRMAVGLGGALGVRVHIAAGIGSDVETEVRNIVQARPHIVVGTPTRMVELVARLKELRQGIGNASGEQSPDLGEARMVILDEVDQMIARNLSQHVGTMLRALPAPSWSEGSPGGPSSPLVSPSLTLGSHNPFDMMSGRAGASMLGQTSAKGERQTAIFSNTVPQDVLTFAQTIQARDSVRVLVRREGTTVTQHSAAGTAGGGGSGAATFNTGGGGGGGGGAGGGGFRSVSPAVGGSAFNGDNGGGGAASMGQASYNSSGFSGQSSYQGGGQGYPQPGSNHSSYSRTSPASRQTQGYA